MTAVNMYKLSLLFLYIRIFPLRSVHIGGYICGAVSTAWNLACIFAAIFQCLPLKKLWEPWLNGRCINLFLAQILIAVPSILCDIAILCLPIPHILPLKTTPAQKLMLIFVFLLGTYVVFTSIYRLRVFLLYTADDVPCGCPPPSINCECLAYNSLGQIRLPAVARGTSWKSAAVLCQHVCQPWYVPVRLISPLLRNYSIPLTLHVLYRSLSSATSLPCSLPGP